MAELVPGPGFIGSGATWEILPPPGGLRYGQYLNIYEMISPVSITAIGVLQCPGGTPGPVQPSQELITSIKIEPGSGAPYSGLGCNIVSSGGPQNIPEMSFGRFKEPFIQHNEIASAPVPQLVLSPCLSGYVTERYFYDMESGFSEIYKGEGEEVKRKDNIRGISRTGGYGVLYNYPRDKRIRVSKNIVGSGFLDVEETEIIDENASRTYGNRYVNRAAARSNYVVSYRPSLIRIIQYNFVITVRSTCPPYVWIFNASMKVQNTWENHRDRVLYRINNQVEAIDK